MLLLKNNRQIIKESYRDYLNYFNFHLFKNQYTNYRKNG